MFQSVGNSPQFISCFVLFSTIKRVNRSRCDKPPLAAGCCHVANDITYFSGDRQTSERTGRQTNRKTSPSRKVLAVRAGSSVNPGNTKKHTRCSRSCSKCVASYFTYFKICNSVRFLFPCLGRFVVWVLLRK